MSAACVGAEPAGTTGVLGSGGGRLASGSTLDPEADLELGE
ncbi:hypothetical protein [Rhodococcus ruber]